MRVRMAGRVWRCAGGRVAHLPPVNGGQKGWMDPTSFLTCASRLVPAARKPPHTCTHASPHIYTGSRHCSSVNSQDTGRVGFTYCYRMHSVEGVARL